MATDKHDKRPPDGPDVDTGTYRGPDRRHVVEDERTAVEVRFDAKGNPVWRIRSDIPRRREKDDTLDLLKCLDNETLALEDDTLEQDGSAFDPYDTAGD